MGCKIIKKKINPDFWGGSILIAFKKDNSIKKRKLTNNYVDSYAVKHVNFSEFFLKLPNVVSVIGFLFVRVDIIIS